MTASARGSTKDKALPRKTHEIAPSLARTRRWRDRFRGRGPRSLSDSGAQSDKNVSRETFLSDWGRKPYMDSYARRLAKRGMAQKNCLLGHVACLEQSWQGLGMFLMCRHTAAPPRR